MQILTNIDYGLFAAGVLAILIILAVVTRRQQWASSILLPPPRECGMTGLDIMLVLWLFMFLPFVAVAIISAINGETVSASEAVIDGETEMRLTVSAALGATVAGLFNAGLMLFFGTTRFKGGCDAWGLNPRRIWKDIAWGVLICLMALPICYSLLMVSEFVLQRIFEIKLKQHISILALLDKDNPTSLIVLTILNAVVIAPIVEELLFRGLLQPYLAKQTGLEWSGIFFSAVLFGLIHFSNIQTVIPLAAFGVILGYAYSRSGSLILPILIHMLFNAKTVLWLMLGAEPNG